MRVGGPGIDISRMSGWLSNAALVAMLLVPIERMLDTATGDQFAIDFRQTFLPAAESLLDLSSPYPALGYPPLVAFLSVPFALTPAPEALAALVVAACVPASLWLLGVRDWRCYLAAFLWVSVFNGVQTANVTLPILLAAAAAWRWRDRKGVASVASGLAIAVKILAWPLAVWLAATRRVWAAAGALLVALGVTFGLWAIVGFSGLLTYGDTVDGAQSMYGDEGYTFRALALDAGLPESVGLAGSLVCLLGLLAGVLVFARRGDDARSFACAAVAMIVASPIVWLHSFSFLLAPVALLRPRLSPVWFVPAMLWFVSPGTGNGAPWQTVVTIAAAVLVVVVTLLPEARLPRKGLAGVTLAAEHDRPPGTVT